MGKFSGRDNADPTKSGLLSFEMIFDIKIQQL
jgi:hypothetical protein